MAISIDDQSNFFTKYGGGNDAADGLQDNRAYMDINGIRIYPKRMVLTDPFEGKVCKETILICNNGVKPVLLRILSPSSSGIRIKTLKHGIFLVAGMSIRRQIIYKVQMMTLIKSCIIPIYINDDVVINYPVNIISAPMNLVIEPDNLIDFGQIDAGPTPTKRTITIVNEAVRPARYSIDLGPNDLQIVVEPSRGIIMGHSKEVIDITMTFLNEGKFATEFWIISDVPACVHVRAEVGIACLEPLYAVSMKCFTFVHFPPIYYGMTVSHNVIVHNNSMCQSFFCVFAEVDSELLTLKNAAHQVADFTFFSIYPEEGRMLPNDIRVFNATYTPKPQNVEKHNYHLVMMVLKRLVFSDLHASDFDDDVYNEPAPKELLEEGSAELEAQRSLDESALSEEENLNGAMLDVRGSCITEVEESNTSINMVRFLLYGQVEEVDVIVVPDELILKQLEINVSVTRVLLLRNNSPTLPIYYKYKKIAFVKIVPERACLEPLESREISVVITPKSYAVIRTKIPFDLLYGNVSGEIPQMSVVGSLHVTLIMDEKIEPKPKSKDGLLVKNFIFKKPNQRPNDMVMQKLLNGPVYVALPDDRPANNLPDPKLRMFKTIYAAMPRYQPKFNEYALTKLDKKHLQAKNYYNMYVRMVHARKKTCKNPMLMDQCVATDYGHQQKVIIEQDPHITLTFIPLTPLQLACIKINPRSVVVENVAFNSSFLHTIRINNENDCIVLVYLRPRKWTEYTFINGNRFEIAAHTESTITFSVNVDVIPMHNHVLDVIINNCYVMVTSILVKARPKHLTLSVEMLTFYEGDPPSKFVELRNELNVNITFQWKVPAVFKVDPIEGEVVSGRFVACMITFAVGLAENMVYDLGIHTDNKYYNLKVLIESTDYKVRIAKSLPFGEISINVPCTKTIPLMNFSEQPMLFEIIESTLVEGIKIRPLTGMIMPYGFVNLAACANRTMLGEFNVKVEILIVHTKKIYFEISGTVLFPDLQFKPEVVRFRKMSASSFDIACVTMVNNSTAVAAVQFDIDRFPEFNYSEYTNSEFLTNRDVITVNPNEEKQFAIHFYPYNPIVTSFPLPLIINKIGTAIKSKTMLIKPVVKVHAQVLSYKLEVKTWRYNFTYFPFYNYKNVTTQDIRVANSGRTPVRFCVRLDELEEPFEFTYKMGAKVTNYECSYVVELQPDDCVFFQVNYKPHTPGKHTIRLPVYVKDDFNDDIHNYFYLTGEYPMAQYTYSENAIYLGFVPLYFTISKIVVVDMTHHHPNCNCLAYTTDPCCVVELDNTKPKGIQNFKVVSLIYSSNESHLMCCRLELQCDCPGPNFAIDVLGGSENNYFTVHSCVQYFQLTSSMSFNALFDPGEAELTSHIPNPNVSTMTMQDPGDREERTKHTFKNDLPYFQSGADPFDEYMRSVVGVCEAWMREQVFFGVRSFSIPDTICLPELKLFDKMGTRGGTIRVPLQLILNYLVGTSIMSQYEIKWSERKPVWMQLRKYYRDILGFLLGINCFVNMIKPEMLLPFDMYCEYLHFTERHQKICLTVCGFRLIAMQAWLDLMLQIYKVLVLNRTLAPLNNAIPGSRSGSSMSMMRDISSMHAYFGVSVQMGTIHSEETILLLKWIDKHFQDHKYKLASDKYGNTMTDAFKEKHITNFDEDLSDGLGIVSCFLSHCAFLEPNVAGIYAPATNRMEKFNNAYIVIQILNAMQVSFRLQPRDIIEPNTMQMIMFFTYLYDFLIPLKNKETLYFSAGLSKTQEESVTIINENKHRLYYNVKFFNNIDDLFSVHESTILVEPLKPFKLDITYKARFLRVQRTVLLLSGEMPGFQYTNSRIYYLESRPVAYHTGALIKLASKIYKVMKIHFEIKSPYPVACDYDVYEVGKPGLDVKEMLASLIPYASILETRTLTRVKLQASTVSADETGEIAMSGELCSLINTPCVVYLLLRNAEVGDFIVRLDVRTKPMKKHNLVILNMSKTVKNFPCTCPKKKPDVYNSKCPRNAKVMIPCRNDFLWRSVMEFFLAGRDEDEAEFWDIHRGTPIGSHILKRILYDQRKYLSGDMDYFMNNSYEYTVHVKNGDGMVTQKKKVINEASMVHSTTEVLVHFNALVGTFYLVLESVDRKETRVYKVRVVYE